MRVEQRRQGARRGFLMFVTVLAGSLGTLGAAPASEGPWFPVTQRNLSQAPENRVLTNYRTYGLDHGLLADVLQRAPMEFTPEAADAAPVLALPMPDGSFQRFRVVESPVLAPHVAAKFPEIRTWSGQGIDDPSATVRLDTTPLGFHAMVLGSRGQVFIDPWSADDTNNYVTYFKKDYRRADGTTFKCLFTGEEVAADHDETGHRETPAEPGVHVANGGTLRTYRLALAATAEYTAAFGGQASAFAQMTTTMNRVNQIYERDMAVRMTIVTDTSIVYTNSATDPYSNSSGSTMLCQNAVNLAATVGNANFDIGHVFSTGGGGIAGLGVVCNNTIVCSGTGASKARGVTGSGSPSGDGYDIDYVAHEMGHQFAGNHTFNGTTGACGGGNRNGSTAFEPGSGTSIQAYAGICGTEDLQSHSDAVFHGGSLDEMIGFINNAGTGDSCDTPTATGNTPPTVNAPAAKAIPANTPFTLTGTGSDANGDTIRYSWEQMDIGTSTTNVTFNTDLGNNPLFRTYDPVCPAPSGAACNPNSTMPSRTFPKLENVIANNLYAFGEHTPQVARAAMKFRLTARDNRANGGGVAASEVTLQVVASTGFAVTAPNTAVSWTGATSQTVTWDVAGTSIAPINTSTVNILLSTDGGLTFPTTILASTPNDGSQMITVPNVSTSQARIKVEAVDNYFWDMSNANFTITAAALPTLSIANSGLAEGNWGAANMQFTVTLSAPSASTVTVQYATQDGTAGAPGDYAAVSGQLLTFDPGVTAVAANVSVKGDTLDEADETFTVQLSSPTNATIDQATATGTIVDDDDTTLIAFDAFVNAGVLSGETAQASASTTSATKEIGEPSHAGNAGGKSLWWQWTCPSSKVVTLSTVGSGFDTLLAVYVGNAVDGLTHIASNDNDESSLESKLHFHCLSGTTYRIAVDGFGGAAGNIVLDLTTAAVPGSSSWVLGGTGKLNGFHPWLVWHDPVSGKVVVWYITGGFSVGFSRTVDTIGTQWSIAGVADFDGDGKADILLRNTSTGQNALWFMDGSTRTSSAFIDGAATSWTISGVGDFNGDDRADILWHAPATQQNAMWLMNGSTRLSAALLQTTQPGWGVGGVGDVGADGKADIVWRNNSTGQNAIWQMDGATRTGAALLPTTADTNWIIGEVVDLNADDKADIVWRRPSTGDRAAWLLDGLNTYTAAAYLGGGSTVWQLAGAGDTSSPLDGKGDLVWRTATGQNALWFMDGLTVSSSVLINSLP